MARIHDLFKKISQTPPSDNVEFPVCGIPGIKHHKLGITLKRAPRFFIKICDENTEANKTVLENIEILYNASCQLVENKKVTEGQYVIVTLSSPVESLNNYFLEIIYTILKKLTAPTTLHEIRTELIILLKLFTAFKQPAKKSVQGLWAELLLIEQSRDTTALLKCWHVEPTDKFDFNDGYDKIEVKSTSSIDRLHRFSLEQLTPISQSKIYICSVICLPVGTGISIKSLVDKIAEKVDSPDLILKLNDVVTSTLGRDLEKAFDLYFDYEMAIDSIDFYDIENIPKIASTAVPSQVKNVTFISDISGIIPVKNKGKHSILKHFN